MSHVRWNPPRLSIRSSKRSSSGIVAGLSHGRQGGRGTVGTRNSDVATVWRAHRFCGAMDTDSQLIDALASDLDRSFEALVLAHQDRIYSIALRMLGDPRDAEEAAQDAFVRAYRALAGYDAARTRELRLRGWLTTILLNVCRNRVRRPGPALVAIDARGPGDERAPSDHLASGDLAASP